MKKLMIALSALALSACSMNDRQVAEAIKRNPKIVFDAIEDNPDLFLAAANHSAQQAQENARRREVAEMKKAEQEQILNPLRPVLDDTRLLAGSKEAEVTIVEYADFQCPACRMAYDNMKPIREKYGKRVNFYYKNMPLDFHKMAMPAALYYEAVAKQSTIKALRFYDELFQNQSKLSEDYLLEAAKKVGADIAKLKSDLKSGGVQKTIDADRAEFEKFGFTGTPVLVVNGVAMHGAQPASEIERVIKATTPSLKD